MTSTPAQGPFGEEPSVSKKWKELTEIAEKLIADPDNDDLCEAFAKLCLKLIAAITAKRVFTEEKGPQRVDWEAFREELCSDAR